MRLLALVLFTLLPQEAPPAAAPAFVRVLVIANDDDSPIPAGTQVKLRMPPRTGVSAGGHDVEVRYAGKSIATWPRGDDVWFRVATDIPANAQDKTYVIRYGGDPIPPRPHEVFERFEDPAGQDPDPKKWSIDPGLKFRKDARGLAVTELPPNRTEFDAASIIALHPPLPAAFKAEAEIHWEIVEGAHFSFAVRAEVHEAAAQTDDARTRCADLVRKLGEDDIEIREAALRELLKLGREAIPQLMDAAAAPDRELRARAENAMTRINQVHPPALLAAGFSVDGTPKSRTKQFSLVGKSRSELAGALPRTGSAVITLVRGANDFATVEWPGATLGPIRSKVPGSLKRLRFDSWGSPGGTVGTVWISRIAVRHWVSVEPRALLGPEEAIR